MRYSAPFFLVLSCLLFTGCAGPSYTVDDGSKVDEKFLADIRAYGQGERLIRPNIARSAALKDPDCDKQWELPFTAVSSYDLDKPERIAWARALKVDERLSVIAVAGQASVSIGDKIAKVDGFHDKDSEKMMERLIELRDDGESFRLTLSTGKDVLIRPIEVCRGHVSVTPPAHPESQDYHWLASTHPLGMFNTPLTNDEALWIVLWTQGLSEEAGARMKTYHYGMKVLKTAYTTASIISGVGAVANAAQTAATQVATQVAAQQASKAATSTVASTVAQQAGKYAAEQAANTARDQAIAAIKVIAKSQAQDLALFSAKQAAVFKSNLSGVAWVAGTGFYMADEWAFKRMTKLGGDPLAAFAMHFTLTSEANVNNAFIMDEDRLKSLETLAAAAGLETQAMNILAGKDRNTSAVEIGAVSLANADTEKEVSKIVITALPDLVPPATSVTDASLNQVALSTASAAPIDAK
jgi:hypothetical protein